MNKTKKYIKDKIEFFSGELNEYNSGYKQALIDIENIIEPSFVFKTTYLLAIITICECYFSHDISNSFYLWVFYGLYKA